MNKIQDYSSSTLALIGQSFADSIARSDHGEKTSLAFIPSPIATESLAKVGETFQVMCFGGSVFETALCLRTKSGYEILQYKHDKLPTLASRETICNIFLKELEPGVSAVGVNFAYAIAAEMRDGRLDGRLLYGSKEHIFHGMVGKLVGEEFEKEVLAQKKRNVMVTVANDTVCLVLAGLSRGATAGGIVGTGMNFGLLEKSASATRVINLEAAGFNEFPQTETGKIVDANSVSPGVAVFEKEVAGAYLYLHYNVLAPSMNLAQAQISSSLDMSILARQNSAETELVLNLFRRSARLVAAQIAGIYWFYNTPRLTLIMEGSMFWKAPGYKNSVNEALVDMGIAEDAILFVEVSRSAINGAAQLVCGAN